MNKQDPVTVVPDIGDAEQALLAGKGIVTVGELYALAALPQGDVHLRRLLTWDQDRMHRLCLALEAGLSPEDRRLLRDTFDFSKKLGAILPEPDNGSRSGTTS